MERRLLCVRDNTNVRMDCGSKVFFAFFPFASLRPFDCAQDMLCVTSDFQAETAVNLADKVLLLWGLRSGRSKRWGHSFVTFC